METLETISLDRHFAQFIAALAENNGEAVFVAALLASMATRRGDSCLRLEEWGGWSGQSGEGRPVHVPSLPDWLARLRDSRVVGVDGAPGPLVLEEGRLYLRRYWEYEQEVAGYLRRQAEAPDFHLDMTALTAKLPGLFPAGKAAGGIPDGQRLAALAVLLRPLVVITGGPGTGKTTTVALALALLGALCRRPAEMPRVALVAPTGKAATRLQEAVARLKAAGGLPPDLTGLLPDRVQTVHRLLGAVQGTALFRYHERNPLPCDLLVVDEASMVDLPLMAKLIRALPPAGRLILSGDRHQLASVEPGSVLGDICFPPALAAFSAGFAAKARLLGEEIAGPAGNAAPGRLGDSLVELKHSRRFGTASGIARLSEAVRAGDAPAAWACLNDPELPDVGWRELGTVTPLAEWLLELVAGGSFSWLTGPSPEEILAGQTGFHVLCALRRGGVGAEEVNSRLQASLTAGGAENPRTGQPVMILDNDYDLQLYNGDTGIIWPAGSASARAFFPDPAGGVRTVAVSRLPAFQPAYAMTVHKSQGSEFDRVALVLPDRFGPVLTRELLFTALTRARQEVVIGGTREVFEQAVATTTERRSGLRRKLWG